MKFTAAVSVIQGVAAYVHVCNVSPCSVCDDSLCAARNGSLCAVCNCNLSAVVMAARVLL